MVKYLGISRAEVRRLLASLEASGGVIINEGHKLKRTVTMVCSNYAKEPHFVRDRRINGEKRKLILGNPRYKTIWIGTVNTYRLTDMTARFVNKIWDMTKESSFYKNAIAKAEELKERAKKSAKRSFDDLFFTTLPVGQIPF